MGLYILRLAEDGPALQDGRIHVSTAHHSLITHTLRMESADLFPSSAVILGKHLQSSFKCSKRFKGSWIPYLFILNIFQNRKIFPFRGFDSQEIHERIYSLNAMWFDLDELRIKGVMNIIFYCSLRSTCVIKIFSSKTFLRFRSNRQLFMLFCLPSSEHTVWIGNFVKFNFIILEFY